MNNPIMYLHTCESITVEHIIELPVIMGWLGDLEVPKGLRLFTTMFMT